MALLMGAARGSSAPKMLSAALELMAECAERFSAPALDLKKVAEFALGDKGLASPRPPVATAAKALLTAM